MSAFEWDEGKAALHLARHGAGFDEACTVFEDPQALTCLHAALHGLKAASRHVHVPARPQSRAEPAQAKGRCREW